MRVPLEERIDRLGRWFRRENERPLLGFYLHSAYPLHRFPGSMKHLPNGRVDPEDVVVQDYLADFERLHGLHDAAGGDLIWTAAPVWGLPWVEAGLGCTVVADHKAGSTRTEPPPGFAPQPTIPQFSESNPWVQKMLEFIPALEERAAGRYPVGVTLMRGISDLLSALYGGQKSVLRMYDDPDEVRAIVDRLADYWISFGRSMLAHLQPFHGGTCAFFYNVWCPGRTVWAQDDSAALLSPGLYEEFIFPAVRRITEAFEHVAFHLHPAPFVPVDRLVRSNVAVIEMHADKGGPGATELLDYYMRVLAAKPLVVWGYLTDADLEFILGHLPHKGLAINIVVDSVDDARTHWHTFRAALGL